MRYLQLMIGEEFAGLTGKIKRVLESNGYSFFPDKTYPNLGILTHLYKELNNIYRKSVHD